jgi:mitochondrial fission protein ELM1
MLALAPHSTVSRKSSPSSRRYMDRRVRTVRTVVWQGSAGNRCPYADHCKKAGPNTPCFREP